MTTRPKPKPPAALREQQYEIAPISTLKVHPRNVNIGDLGAIHESIESSGFYGAVVAQRSTGHVLAGNHRLMAAEQAGIRDLPVIWLEVDDERALRILVADNRTTRLGTDDQNALAALLAELSVTVDGLAGTGYDGDALDELIADLAGMKGGLAEGVDHDDLPESLPARCTPGDLWQLGEHRLLCADSRDAASAERVMGVERINLAITSPPYASQRKYDESSAFKPIRPGDYAEWFEPVQSIIANHLAADGSYFLNIKEHCEKGSRHLYVKDLTITHVRKWGWMLIDEFCWRDTKNGVPGKWPNRFKDAWEPVFHYARSDKIKFRCLANAKPSDDCVDYSYGDPRSSTGSGLMALDKSRYHPGLALPSNVIEIAAASSGAHPAPYPVALASWFIRAYSDLGDVVFDPFLGSGTTLMAAESEGRFARGIEISPTYCDVILARWENATGQTAQLIDARPPAG